MSTAVDGAPPPVRPVEEPSAEPGPTDPPVDRWRAVRRWIPLAHRLFPYAVASAVSLLVALWTYRPWLFTGTMASVYGDPLAFHTWVQATIENGWYEYADRLSAPYGMNSHTYTVTDELLFTLIGKVLAPLTGSAGGAVTMWVVLSFPLAAVFAVAAARSLGVGRLAAIVPGIAFALLPDHFMRGSAHFSLASTWAISLGVLVALTLLRPARTSRRGRIWLEVALLVACLSISLTNAYYATFTALLVAVVAVGGSVAQRSWSILARGAARCVALLAPIVVAIQLDARYAPDPQGYSAFEITRSLADAEVYGGKILPMLLPGFMHRFPAFRELRSQYDTAFPNPAEYPSLGLVATVGFLGLVVWAVLAQFRRRPDLVDARLRPLAGLMWVAVLAYVVGGIGSVWAMLLDGGGLRVWSRMHVVIAMIALLAVAVALDRIRGRLLRAGAVGLVLLVVMVDQTTPLARPDPAAATAVRTEVTTLTDQIADLAGPDAMIYQAPFVTFPVRQMVVAPASDYDGFLPYLYSTGTDLSWSYGGLQGDPGSDWNIGLAARPFAEAAPLLQAAGFAGVVLDRGSLASLPELEAQVTAVLGEPDLRSTGDRWLYFSLDLPVDTACRAGAVADELASLAVEPPLLYPGEGMNTRPGMFGNDAGTAELRVVTLREGGWPTVDVSFFIETPVPIRVTLPDGSQRELPAGPQTVTWSGPVTEDESPIVLERTADGGAYVLRDLRASTLPSPAAAACLPEPAPEQEPTTSAG